MIADFVGHADLVCLPGVQYNDSIFFWVFTLCSLCIFFIV